MALLGEVVRRSWEVEGKPEREEVACGVQGVGGYALVVVKVVVGDFSEVVVGGCSGVAVA